MAGGYGLSRDKHVPCFVLVGLGRQRGRGIYTPDLFGKRLENSLSSGFAEIPLCFTPAVKATF